MQWHDKGCHAGGDRRPELVWRTERPALSRHRRRRVRAGVTARRRVSLARPTFFLYLSFHSPFVARTAGERGAAADASTSPPSHGAAWRPCFPRLHLSSFALGRATVRGRRRHGLPASPRWRPPPPHPPLQASGVACSGYHPTPPGTSSPPRFVDVVAA